MRRSLLILLVALVPLACSVADQDTLATPPVPPEINLPTLQTCERIENAFAAETEYVRYCEQDADCGMVLTGTSCGCTRDWVARRGVDTSRFYALIELGSERQCDLLLVSTCDCPPADGFACVSNQCVWNYTSR